MKRPSLWAARESVISPQAPLAVVSASSERPARIEAAACPNSTSSNSSSCTIMITMTGVMGDQGHDG